MDRRRRAAVGYHERPGSGATPGSFLAGHLPAPAKIAHSEVSLPSPALDSSRGQTAGHDVGPAVRAEIQAQRPQCDRAAVRERHPPAPAPEAPLAARGRPIARCATGCADCAVARPQPAGGQPSPPTTGDTGTPVRGRSWDSGGLAAFPVSRAHRPVYKPTRAALGSEANHPTRATDQLVTGRVGHWQTWEASWHGQLLA